MEEVEAKQFVKTQKAELLQTSPEAAELEAIATAVQTAIGHCVSVAPLLSLIATYAIQFVSVVATLKSCTPGGGSRSWYRLRKACVVRSQSSTAGGGNDDGAALILCETSDRFYIQSLHTGIVRPFCGSDELGFVSGSASTTRFQRYKQACVDPIRSNCYYLIDQSSIRHFDQPNDKVTLIAGGPAEGDRTGCGSEARFGWIGSPLVTRDGKTMFVLDQSNERVWRVDLTTRNVTVSLEISNLVAIDMTWTRGPLLPGSVSDPPFVSILTDSDGDVSLFCRDLSASVDLPLAETPLVWSLPPHTVPTQMVCTSAGLHLVSSESRLMIFCFDTRTESWIWIAGSTAIGSADGPALSVSFAELNAIALDEIGRCLYVVEASAVRKVTLPPEYFVLSGCCDCDRDR